MICGTWQTGTVTRETSGVCATAVLLVSAEHGPRSVPWIA